MISVIATITTKPDQRNAFVAIFKELMPQVRAEDGCIEYFPAVDVDSGIDMQGGARDHVVTVLEKWESLDALKSHLDAPHMHEFRGRVQALVESLTLQVVQPVE